MASCFDGQYDSVEWPIRKLVAEGNSVFVLCNLDVCHRIVNRDLRDEVSEFLHQVRDLGVARIRTVLFAGM